MGECEIDQIFKIFQYHGTPNEKNWPWVMDLPYMKSSFPAFKGGH